MSRWIRYEWLADLEQQGRLEKYVAVLPAVNMQRIRDTAVVNKLMTKDDLERALSAPALTTKQRQLEALKERYEHAGQLDTTSDTQLTSVDCHKVQYRPKFTVHLCSSGSSSSSSGGGTFIRRPSSAAALYHQYSLYIIRHSRFVCDYYPPFASIAKGEVFGLLYVCLFVCSSTISRQPAGRFTPKFACRRTLVPDVSSPLLGVGGPRRAEKGAN